MQRNFPSGQKMKHSQHLPTAFFMTDTARGTAPGHVAALPPGTAVIFRDYNHPDRTNLAKAYQRACQQHGTMFFVAGDKQLAIDLNADGLHLPEHGVNDIEAIPAGRFIISTSCHSKEAILRAAKAGADLAFLSPIFPTRSHPDAKTIGIEGLADALNISPIPIYALGGINQDSIKHLPDHPMLAGFAGIGCFVK